MVLAYLTKKYIGVMDTSAEEENIQEFTKALEMLELIAQLTADIATRDF